MTAEEIIETLTEIVNKRGDKVVFINGYEALVVDYNVADDCIDIEG